MSTNAGFNIRQQLEAAGEAVKAENEAQYSRESTPQAPEQTPEPARSTKGRSQARRFDKMARIEGRLHYKQLRELNALTLKLRDHRNSPGGERERITNNTLLRVAVEVLLKHQSALKGSTERELTDSLMRHLSENADS